MISELSLILMKIHNQLLGDKARHAIHTRPLIYAQPLWRNLQTFERRQEC
jgi:hypothetical protein